MITFNDFTDGFKSLCSQFFVFNSQSSVSYVVRDNCQFDLSRLDLVRCIHYFLSRLHKIGLSDKIKSDYKFETYDYFDLSLYLNRLLQYYNNELNLPPVKPLFVVKPSPLSIDYDSDELPELVIDCAYLASPVSKLHCYVALLNLGHPICRLSIDELRDKLQSLYPLNRVILKVVGS